MSKETKRKWTVSEKDATCVVVDGYAGTTVCRTNMGLFSDADNEANARLIAAAPEMRHALQALVKYVNRYCLDCSDKSVYLSIARRALAKSEGKLRPGRRA